MAYLMNVGGKKITYHEWVAKHTEADERAELIDALSPYINAASAGPVSLEKFSKDFCNLSDEDRKSFMKTMQEAIAVVQAEAYGTEFDSALQAAMDRRNQVAANDAWNRTVADAKARAEAARQGAA
jgi:hypothetical protein